jgi:hypothetical protein
VTEVQDAPAAAPPQLRRKPAEKAARAVPLAGAGVWTAAEIMHATGIPWLDIGLGTLAAAGAVYGKGARGGAGWLLAAGAWSALAARFGPLAGPGWYFPLTGAWAALTFTGWRWARSHPAVLEARGKRLASEDWLATAHRYGLKGSHLLHHEVTRLGERKIIDVKGTGKRASQIAGGDVAERIAEDEGLPVSRVQVKRHRLAGRVEISIRRTDPWAKPIIHPALDPDPEIDLSGLCTCREPFIIGQDPETGTPLTLTVWDQDGAKRILIVATSRAGKTVLINNLRERATKAPDVLVVNLNLSKGIEDRQWDVACHLTAITRQQATRAVKILRMLERTIEWRSQQPRDTAVFQPSAGHPLILFIGDEIDALASIPAAREALKTIYSKGGSEAVAPVIAGQRGTAEWIGGGDVRALVDVFCIGAVSRRGEMMHAAGDLGLEMPDMASYGDGHKGVWAIAELGGSVRTGRTFLLKEPGDLRRMAEERAMDQPNLEPELESFLGDSYARLLSDEPFTRWAHGRRKIGAGPEPEPVSPSAPRGADPHNPLHALALAVRDGTVEADGETAETLANALKIEERASLDAYDREAEDHLSTLDESDPLRRRWVEQGRRNAATRRLLAEASAEPVPDIPHEAQLAHAAERWRQVGEATEIPDEARGKLLGLLSAGTTISEVARVLEVTKWTARTYLERLRTEGLVRMAGEKRTARWLLTEPPGGDTP